MLRHVLLLFLVGCRFDLDAVARPCAVDDDCGPGSSCGDDGRCVRTSDGGVVDELDATVVDMATNSDAMIATSCAGVSLTCGATSCCESIAVPGGIFYRVFDNVVNTTLQSPAAVSPSRHDMFEVTVGRFRQFVLGGFGTQGNPPAAGAGGRTLNGTAGAGGWDSAWNVNLKANTTLLTQALKCDSTFQTWQDTAAATENKPINCVTWYEAMAFCIWDGGFLPTDAERHFVASGGTQQRYYPWSSPSTSTTINNTHASYADGGCNGDGLPACEAADLFVVHGKSPAGDGRWGHSGLGGNVWEWILDWQATLQAGSCIDCAVLVPTTDRGVRGGAYSSGTNALQSTHIYDPRMPDARAGDVGFRCAR